MMVFFQPNGDFCDFDSPNKWFTFVALYPIIGSDDRSVISFKEDVMSIGKKIASLRKEKGWTQAELGEKLAVSNQAVSKWESEMTMPDIMMLPAIAGVFDCSIDALFSDEAVDDSAQSLPWENDDVIRCAVFRGTTVLQVVDGAMEKLCCSDVGEVTSEANVIVIGNVSGDCTAKGCILVTGHITGDCMANGHIEAKEWISGDCSAKGNIVVGGNLSGECDAKGGIYTPDGKLNSQTITFS